MCCNQNENTRGCFGVCASSDRNVFINPIPRYIAGPIGPAGPAGPQGEPGVVTPAAAVADAVVAGATAESNAGKINEILAALRAAGLMET